MFYCLEENLSECTCQKTNVNLRERSFMIISKIRWHILASQVLVEIIVFLKYLSYLYIWFVRFLYWLDHYLELSIMLSKRVTATTVTVYVINLSPRYRKIRNNSQTSLLDQQLWRVAWIWSWFVKCHTIFYLVALKLMWIHKSEVFLTIF